MPIEVDRAVKWTITDRGLVVLIITTSGGSGPRERRIWIERDALYNRRLCRVPNGTDSGRRIRIEARSPCRSDEVEESCTWENAKGLGHSGGRYWTRYRGTCFCRTIVNVAVLHTWLSR